jgi:hypothetical protein
MRVEELPIGLRGADPVLLPQKAVAFGGEVAGVVEQARRPKPAIRIVNFVLLPERIIRLPLVC